MANLINMEFSKSEMDELIGGAYPHVLTGGVIIASGAGVLKRGTVLGQETASGKYKTADSTKDDGSQVGSAVLMHDVDATSTDVKTEAYISGMFNKEKLIFGGSDDASKQENNLRIHNIYMTTLLK